MNSKAIFFFSKSKGRYKDSVSQSPPPRDVVRVLNLDSEMSGRLGLAQDIR